VPTHIRECGEGVVWVGVRAWHAQADAVEGVACRMELPALRRAVEGVDLALGGVEHDLLKVEQVVASSGVDHARGLQLAGPTRHLAWLGVDVTRDTVSWNNSPALHHSDEQRWLSPAGALGKLRWRSPVALAVRCQHREQVADGSQTYPAGMSSRTQEEREAQHSTPPALTKSASCAVTSHALRRVQSVPHLHPARRRFARMADQVDT
jgi:hypothetical protein